MKKIFILFSIIIYAFTSQAQEALEQNEANYIYGFVRLMDWPKYDDNLVVVNVLGETVVFDLLNYMAQDKQVGGRKLVARQTTIDNVTDCNILFVTKDKTYLLPEITAQTVNKNILIITESPNMTNNGADVSFEYSSSSPEILEYSFNLKSIQEKNIKVAIEFIGYGAQEKDVTTLEPEAEPETEVIIED